MFQIRHFWKNTMISCMFKECQEIKEEEFDVEKFISRLSAI